MTKLEKSKTLDRMLRKDDIADLGISTRWLLKEAIRSQDTEEALRLLDFLNGETSRLTTRFWLIDLLDFIVENLGEEKLYESMLHSGEKFWRERYEKVPLLPPEERIQSWIEIFRATPSGPRSLGDVTVTEDEEKYTMKAAPCGTGGRLRLLESEGKIPKFGRTIQAYPWSWGKVGVPYHCCHCCVMSEIQPIDWNGFPVRVTEYEENPRGDCTVMIYKDPMLIPDKYFERVGRKKDPSKFKKYSK